jgi:lipopolysaccharide/colanic/teichoic acid biosynthesis glycosyltransferase
MSIGLNMTAVMGNDRAACAADTTPADLPESVAVRYPQKIVRSLAPQFCAAIPDKRVYIRIKLVIEWVAALILLVLAAPMLAVLAGLVKLASRGPAFYTQIRLGQHGRPFKIYKLRTMTHRCETATGPVWSVENDLRVTRLGRYLRDTHLDEIPQLWNILRGHMSLIGPRPERPEIAVQIERALPEFRKRLLVRPGITGLAQVCLRPDSDLDSVSRKLAHDLQYLHKMSAILDVRIMLSTVLHLVGAAAMAVSRQLIYPCVPLGLANAPIAFTARAGRLVGSGNHPGS